MKGLATKLLTFSCRISSLTPFRLTSYRYKSLLRSSNEPTSSLDHFLHMHSNSISIDPGFFPTVLSDVSSLLNRRYEEAWLILGKFMSSYKVAFTIALGACSKYLNLGYGREIHCAIVRRGLCGDTMLCNALLDMYAKLGEIAAARLVFNSIHNKDVVSWTSIIDVYGNHGFGAEALSLFRTLEEEGNVLPNDVTFLSILSACSHSSRVGEGGKCFFSMKDKYEINPEPEHYVCYIDMLGRAGEIKEAWEVFCKLDKLTSEVCMLMLNACRVNGDLVRVEIVIPRLLKMMHPKNSTISVLIKNFDPNNGSWLSSRGRGARSARLVKVEGQSIKDRKAMWTHGLRKQVGASLLF